MMKNALMVVSTPDIINIGDYIQALAAKQYFDRIDALIERERLSQYRGEDVKMIMNGWYMIEPQYWPPSDRIHPLFVSFHINVLAKKMMLSTESLSYLKKYEPIGCRDIDTMQMLREKNIDAFYTGCLTLTLNLTYETSHKTQKIYFVDPAVLVSRMDIKTWIFPLYFFVTHFQKIRKLMVHFKHYKSRRGMWLVASSFYATYSKMFSDDFIFNAEFIDHESPEIGRKYPTHNDKFDRADGLLRHYAAAKCVVTSRIHCALPCLSLGTPVIYVASENQGTVSSCRLKGIYELLNVMRLHSDGTLKSDFKIDGKINIDNFPSNKNKYKMLQQQLVRLCRRFVQK